MELSSTKSTKVIQAVLLVLMCIQIAWTIGTKIYNFELYKHARSTFWLNFSLRTLISLFLIVMIYKKKYGILLFLIVMYSFGFISSIVDWKNFKQSTMIDYAFYLMHLSQVILMILLLHREDKRFFNLKFSSTEIEFPKTYKLIQGFNAAILIFMAIVLTIIFVVVKDVNILMYPFSGLWLFTLSFFIIGLLKKSKFQLLAFACAGLIFFELFTTSPVFIQCITENNWGDSWPSTPKFGLLGLLFILVFGIYLVTIIKKYTVEKRILGSDFYGKV